MRVSKGTLCLALVLILILAASPHAAAQTNDKPPSGGSHDVRVRHFESDIEVRLADNEPTEHISLEKLMQLFKIPGLSIAVIDNYHVVWAKGYGVIEAGSTKPVTPRTLFQAASISKTVTATAALALVEQGKLALDEDVNKRLTSWKVPENEFTKNEKVTLRRLMSHTAGTTVHGFPGYDVDAPIPTLVQVLNGEKPANTSPIRVDVVPGTRSRYSGGGVVVEQQLMMDVTGKPFPVLMREAVLDKISMTDSSFEQPLPSASAAKTATATYASGKAVHGRWHIYPEMAAAGLWTTPTDLARFGIEIALSRQGKSNRVLSDKITREMLTPVLEDIGLAFFLDKNNPGQFGHTGSNEGFQSLLTMNFESGYGVVLMANSDIFYPIENFLVQSIAREYRWKYKLGESDAFQTLFLNAKLKGAQAALQRYSEIKSASPEKLHEELLNGLGYSLMSAGQIQDAVAIFQRNVQEYPGSANAYDSLGEGYMNAGQKNLAIQNYEKSLQLNPKNQNAVDMIKKLKATQ